VQHGQGCRPLSAAIRLRHPAQFRVVAGKLLFQRAVLTQQPPDFVFGLPVNLPYCLRDDLRVATDSFDLLYHKPFSLARGHRWSGTLLPSTLLRVATDVIVVAAFDFGRVRACDPGPTPVDTEPYVADSMHVWWFASTHSWAS